MKLPRRFFQPLATGAPAPFRELPVKLERMIHFVPPHNEKVRARVPELAATVAFVAERRAACTGAPPERFPEITAENLRSRTRLAGMGLVPTPIGRTYEQDALLWCRCTVQERADGWLDVSMILDS